MIAKPVLSTSRLNIPTGILDRADMSPVGDVGDSDFFRYMCDYENANLGVETL
jgi:hypothetical protein